MNFPIYTIYKHPVDYPDKFVCRMFDMGVPTHVMATADTLAEIRSMLPEGLLNLGRDPADDPCVVEVWL